MAKFVKLWRAVHRAAILVFALAALAARVDATSAAPAPATTTGSAAPAPPASPPPYRFESLRHVGQWTGVHDPLARKVSLRATDLGVSFPVAAPGGKSQLMFLFGDTHPYGEPFVGRWDEDSVALAPAQWDKRDRPPALRWLTRPDGQFLSLLVPGKDLRAMDVPLDGIQLPGRVVLFFNAGYDKAKHGHASLVCAKATNGDVRKLTKRFEQPTTKFLNVSVSPDPADPQTVWIFGTGRYRRSPIYLAKAPAATLDDFSTWRFLAAGGAWAAREEDATPLLDGRLGELSARWIPAAKQWAMMYQRRFRPERQGQAIYLRFAPHPTGPWSDEVPVLEPDADTGVGFTQFIHAAESAVKFDDGLANPGREGEWGDPYGAYLVPEWCRVDGGRLHLVHTLSVWNPYSVHLMEAVLAPPGPAPATAIPSATVAARAASPPIASPAPAGALRAGAAAAKLTFPSATAWSGQPFVLKQHDGKSWITPAKAAGTRRTRWVVPQGAAWLSFDLNGAGVVARLTDEAGNFLRESRGDASTVRTARWRVDNLHGRSVTFELTAPAPAGGPPAGITPPTVEPPRAPAATSPAPASPAPSSPAQ